MKRLTRLSDWPWAGVYVECRLCPRRGRYRLARLAAKLGPETALEGVLAALAADCHLYERNAKLQANEARCGIRFTVLWTSRRPSPGAPALRVVGGRR